jgi:hypothetical protein
MRIVVTWVHTVAALSSAYTDNIEMRREVPNIFFLIWNNIGFHLGVWKNIGFRVSFVSDLMSKLPLRIFRVLIILEEDGNR